MSRCCLSVGIFLGLLARSVSPSAAAETPPGHDLDGAPRIAPAVQQAMQDRDYAAARKAIDEAAKAKDAPSDYLAYLRAWSLHLDKQDDQSIAALEKFEKDYPQSKWLRRARFAKAQAMVAKGDFRGAQAIYESEAKYLLSDLRRQQSAEVYLEFADACFQPSQVGQRADYNAARKLYAVALESGLSGPRRTDVEFRMAICLQKLNLFAEAAKGFEEFLARHADDPRQNEVRYRQGECLLSAGKLAEARKAWRELLYAHRETTGVRRTEKSSGPTELNPPSPPAPLPVGEGSLMALTAAPVPKGEGSLKTPSAARDWPAEAAFHLAETWHCPQPRDEDDLRRGVNALRDFLARYPTHELAGQAHLEIAAIQINRQHFDDAIATMQNFLRDPRWKDCKQLPDAQRELGNIYLSQKKYAEAITAWREYLTRFPAHESWNEVQRSIVDAEFTTGLDKFKTGDYDAATRFLSAFMTHYPLDARNPQILLLFGEIQQRQKKWDAAIAAWQRLAAKYPRSQEAARANDLIARTLDEELGRYEEAREQYRKIGNPAAAAAIAAKQMRVETPRAFRSDETPQLRLATRNVSSVKVRVYKIDLETYFRKMHSIAGIERLDVSLIDPDATLEFLVPKFAKYRPLESSIPVPLADTAVGNGLRAVPADGTPQRTIPTGKAGVAAVTVGSPNQEATTLVIQSDLEIVLRASPGEALVFAQNARTGKPWPGVRLLLSDGKSVFAEGKTGDDGFFARQLPLVDQMYVLRVFAAAEGGHVASTALRLPAGPDRVELSERIFVDTDRAAYRAGELVHVRGCARHAEGDRLVVEEGKKLSVELRDSADRRLRKESVRLSALGTFACDFPLPREMPEGSYSIVVNDDAGHHRTTQFEIGSPPAETARLEIDLPRHVYYRGETIEGTFRAVLPQDRPLRDAKIEYQFGNQPATTVTTDARGEAHFAITTDELEGYGATRLLAANAANEISGECDLTIATRGFSIELSTARPVYVAGENFDVKIKTLDAAGKPSAQKLLVKVTRKQTVGDEMLDELVEEHSLATAADGAAHLTLKPAKGDSYTIAASGTDRFGNTIQKSLNVYVSGDGDRERLLLLTDRTELKAGDTAEVQLYWRGEPATAVVTTHYDRLREHRLVELHKGSNHLAIPVTAAMAPGFTLAVAVMDRVPLSHRERAGEREGGNAIRSTILNPPSPPAPLPIGEGRADAFTSAPLPVEEGRRLYAAECAFSVDPNLQVRLECHRHGDATAKPRPGEPIDVTVTTCDAQGKPLAAEVSFSALPSDRSAGDWPRGALPRFVLGRGHDAEFVTASSIQFHYRPFHRTIAADVPDGEAATIPAGISPQVGIRISERQPTATRSVSEEIATRSVGEESVPGPRATTPPTDEEQDEDADRQADLAALKSAIENTPNPRRANDAKPRPPARAPAAKRPARAEDAFGDSADDPFAPEPTVAKPAAPPAEVDPFADAPRRAEVPARVLPRAARRHTATPNVIRCWPPSWAGYWNPVIATGRDGRATVTFTPPDDAADLTIAARAIAAGNLTGQASLKAALKKDLAAEIHLPSAFTDGDQMEIPVVVHNDAIDQGAIDIELCMNVDGTTWSEKKTLAAKGRGRLETTFKPLVRMAQRPSAADGFLPTRPEAAFTLTVKAAGQTDIVRRSVPIRPYGEACQVTAAGVTIAGNAAVAIAPTRSHWTAPALRLAVSPNIQRSLLDMLDPPADEHINVDAAYTDGIPAAGDLMAALALAKHYPPASAESQLLDERIRGALCVLIASQQRDGGWLACGRPAAMATNAVAYWSLVLADKSGYDVPREVREAALQSIRQSLASNLEGDPALKAIALHALALGGQGDFSLANQLLRDRTTLSPLARAYLALALVRMGRSDTAVELLKQAEGEEKGGAAREPDFEAEAISVLALLGLNRDAPRAKVMVEDLLSRRAGLRWKPENATGPAVLAIAEWLPRGRAADGHLTIVVNGKELKTLDMHAPTQIVNVPTSRLVKGKQRIELHTLWKDQVVAYRATLSGVEPAESVGGSSSAWRIERSYEPPLMEVDGQKILRGFSTLSGDGYSAAFSNRMTQLPAARRGFVELKVFHWRLESTSDDPFGIRTDGGDLVIVEPLPSGATVVESSLDGTFDRAEILPGRIVFYINHGTPRTPIHYELEGVFPGANLVSPALLYRAGRAAPLAVTKPKALEVLPQGVKSSDPYRLSPDELLTLGTLAKRKGDVAAAMRYFSELLESWHGRRDFGLAEPAYKQTVVALMQLGMGRAAPTKLVQYCETIKEKWPDEPVTLDQLLTAAGAYREIGETERSYMACRAAVEGSFTRESGVAGFLENEGEFLRSVGMMERLLRDYPPEAYVAEAEFGLAQRVYVKASEQQLTPPRQNQPGMQRDALIARAGAMLDAFLAANPHDPAADQAAFAAANVQLDLKHYAAAAETAAAAARRYPKSDLLDSYWYMLAYCDFALSKYPAAIDMCRKVAQAQHLDKETGRMVDSENKHRAIYILGQIYQSLGQRGDAIREYRRVEDRIPDAKSSVAYFVRKEIALPECTTLKPGAAAEVELRYRNIAGCDVKVYRVDLVKFCETGQALGDLGQVNLSGIRPLRQSSVALAGGGDYADHVQKLSLPLKKEGAYLVVCRGEDLYASGLLLISPLEIEHRFDASTGQIRVFVKDASTGRCASEVQVKLLPRGPNVPANVAGTTDLRGVFVANSPATGVTIVAQAGPGQYAYVASPPVANEPKGGVAQIQFPELDPTAPFGSPEVGRLMDLINTTAAEKNWKDMGGDRGPMPQPIPLRVRGHLPAPGTAAPECPLPPPGPLAPTNLAGEETAAERRIRAALASPTSLEFVETPLKDVVEYLKDAHRIEIQLDAQGLKDAGVDPEAPVTQNLKGVSLEAALRLMLDELQLKYVIHNEVLLITSPQKAESDEFMVTKAYPVQDLVLPGSDGTVDMQPLMDLLQNTVATKSWVDNGGNGTISDFIVGNRSLLVISQTQEVHAEIEKTLEMIRKAGGLKAGSRRLAEQEQTEDETDLPVRPRVKPHRPQPPMGQGFGGMGGFGGGMGGMGGGMGMGGRMSGRSQTPFAISTIPVIDGGSPGGDADLLGGLKSTNAANQNSKVQHLKQRQDAGQGMGGGMGGMGGGFF